MKRRLESLLFTTTTAWVVLAVSVVMTVLAWSVADAYRERDAEQRFHESVEVARRDIVARMQAYQEVLRAGAGLFDSSDDVSRSEWRTFVKAMRLKGVYPGIQGLGFSEMVAPEAKPALEERIRKEGYPDFRIKPAGQRGQYSAIIYLEPFDWRNQRAFGYDMFSEPVRREAMERACDTGRITLSGHVTLVQETDRNVQRGFLMYMPIYRHGMPLGSVAQRRAALFGYVYGVFRAGDLMRGILGQGLKWLHFDLYDGKVGHGSLLYQSDAVLDRINRTAPDESRLPNVNLDHEPRYQADVPIDIGGRRWIARFSSSPYFEDAVASTQPALIAMGGILADLLLFAALYSISKSGRLLARRNAELARSERALRDEKSRYAVLVENVPGVVFRCGVTAPWPVHFVSQRVNELCGVDAEEFTEGQCGFADFLHPDDVDWISGEIAGRVAESRPYEITFRFQHADGDYRWFAAHGAAHVGTDGQPKWLDGVMFDVTEFKALEAERIRTEALIRDLAFLDPLTRLPNRRLLSDRLKQALAAARRSRHHGALLFIDLDNFKQINDSLGHEAGDHLLIEVADRLKGCVREEDTVARLGGDEFVVMLGGLSEDAEESALQVRRVGEKILASLNEAYHLGPHVCQSTPSIGATLYLDDQEGVDAIFRRADTAMYQVKLSGRNALRFFDEGVEMLMSERALLEACLTDGVPGNELVLQYQPLLDLDERLVGVEALVRWQHPTRGLLLPADFMTQAEDSGLIVRLGMRILELACERLADWANKPTLAQVDMTVNVNVKQLGHLGFLDQVQATLARTGADPNRLIFELCEGRMNHDNPSYLDTILALRRLGIRFSLDDFGACYFNLGAVLRTIPFDQLKLEQNCLPGLAQGLPSPELVRALIALGNSVGAQLVAKGVETQAQWSSLREMGCQRVQGALFSWPLSAEELERVWGDGGR